MKRIVRVAAVSAFLLLLLSCATSPPPTEYGKPVPAAGLSSDTELFEMGLAALERGGAPGDLAAARTAFTELPRAYPGSRWLRISQLLVRLIEEQARLAESARSEARSAGDAVAETTRLKRENDQLRREMRQLQERLQTESGSLQQENEQLKKDLKLLKDLELQLHQRNRTVR